MGLFKCRSIKTIDSCLFGRVTCPILVDYDSGCLETHIEYGISDLTNLMQDISFYYATKSDRSQRQSEISELAAKLSHLLKKEKCVHGRIWSPIKLKLEA